MRVEPSGPFSVSTSILFRLLSKGCLSIALSVSFRKRALRVRVCVVESLSSQSALSGYVGVCSSCCRYIRRGYAECGLTPSVTFNAA